MARKYYVLKENRKDGKSLGTAVLLETVNGDSIVKVRRDMGRKYVDVLTDYKSSGLVVAGEEGYKKYWADKVVSEDTREVTFEDVKKMNNLTADDVVRLLDGKRVKLTGPCDWDRVDDMDSNEMLGATLAIGEKKAFIDESSPDNVMICLCEGSVWTLCVEKYVSRNTKKTCAEIYLVSEIPTGYTTEKYKIPVEREYLNAEFVKE